MVLIGLIDITRLLRCHCPSQSEESPLRHRRGTGWGSNDVWKHCSLVRVVFDGGCKNVSFLRIMIAYHLCDWSLVTLRMRDAYQCHILLSSLFFTSRWNQKYIKIRKLTLFQSQEILFLSPFQSSPIFVRSSSFFAFPPPSPFLSRCHPFSFLFSLFSFFPCHYLSLVYFFSLSLSLWTNVTDRVFANGRGDRGSIPVRVIPKTQKMVLDAALLNTQNYKLRIQSKVEQSSEWSSALN